MKQTVPILFAAVMVSRAYAASLPVADRANTSINAATNTPIAQRLAPDSTPSAQQQALGGIVVDWFQDPQQQTACYAQYAPPQFDTDDLNASFSEQVTTINTDTGTLYKQGESNLSGNVLISQPNRNLEAERLQIYRDAKGDLVTADAYQHVLLEEPQLRIVADEAHIKFSSDDLQLNHAEFRNYAQHGRGSAASISRHAKEPVIMRDVTYTTCPPGDNMWELRSGSLKLNQQTEQGDAFNTWVYIKGVPVAYTPWISFPLSNKRKSGLLKPTLGQTERSGFEARLPYYWNIAPDYDATITPLVQVQRGLHLQTEQRYLWQGGSGALLAELQPHDRKFAQFKMDTLLTNPDQLAADDIRLTRLQHADPTRKAIGWTNNWAVNDQWNLTGDFQWASDDNYFVDLDSAIGVQNYRTLRRLARAQYSGEHFNMRSQIEDYQTLQPYQAAIILPAYRMLPEIDAEYAYPNIIDNFDVELPATFTVYDHTGNPLTLEELPTGQMYDVGPALQYKLQYPYAYIKPRLQLRYSQYILNQDLPNANRSLPLASIDSGVYFERDSNWFGRDYLQTFEPRLYYLYVPYKDQNAIPIFDTGLSTFSFDQLFSDNRFSGHDRIGDANQLTYSVLSRWLVGDSGAETARLSAGQIIYFQNRRVTACDSSLDGPTPDCILNEDPSATDRLSDFVGEGVWHINDSLNLIGDLQLDPHNRVLHEYSTRLEWHQSVDRIFNFRYNVNRDVNNANGAANQVATDTSFVWRFSPRWRILSRWNYDWTKQMVIDEFGGIEYENCCWAIRTGARSTLNLNDGLHRTKDQQYFIQWAFKGLTSFGDTFIDQKGLTIPGYRDNFATTY